MIQMLKRLFCCSTKIEKRRRLWTEIEAKSSLPQTVRLREIRGMLIVRRHQYLCEKKVRPLKAEINGEFSLLLSWSNYDLYPPVLDDGSFCGRLFGIDLYLNNSLGTLFELK